MSELLESVRRSFYHEVLCYRDAESRLEGREGSYLLRESDVKKGIFIISYVKSSSVSHILVPNSKGTYHRQSLEQAVDIAADIIAASDCLHPVPPPGQASSGSDTGGSDTEASNAGASDTEESRCYCCSFTSSNKKTLHNHHLNLHKLFRCQNCSRYFKNTSFRTHKRKCGRSENLSFSCSVCGYETIHDKTMRIHRKMHLTRPFLCRVEDCRRCFKTQQDLDEHQKFHQVDGFQCDLCDKKFRRRWERTRHMVKMHQNVKRSSTIGFGLFNMTGVIQRRQKGRQMMTCLKEGCNFQTRLYQTTRMAIHVAAKHPDRPRPKKPHQCRGCKKMFAYPYLLHKHEKTCKLEKANSKRIVPMVTNRSLVSIKKKYVNVPNTTFCNIMRDLQKENPAIIFEGNFQHALQESINELKRHFSAEFLNLVDKHGLEVNSVIVLVKDLHYCIREYIRRKGVKNPRVAIGQDGGNKNKYLVCLVIHDMDRLGLDICGYSSGGRRRALVIAACNRCKEFRYNLDQVMSGLYLAKLEYRTILPSDLKAANLIMGIGPHTSLCPCIYCEAHKMHDKTGKPTTDKAKYWSENARRRTLRIIRDLRKHFLAKWGGRQGGISSARAKADIKKFFSVVGFPIELPEAWLDELVLVLVPPDPLHVTLLGKYNFTKHYVAARLQL